MSQQDGFGGGLQRPEAEQSRFVAEIACEAGFGERLWGEATDAGDADRMG